MSPDLQSITNDFTITAKQVAKLGLKQNRNQTDSPDHQNEYNQKEDSYTFHLIPVSHEAQEATIQLLWRQYKRHDT